MTERGSEERIPSTDPNEIEARQDVARAIDPSVFPAEREAIIDSARANHAPAPVIQTLEGLPEGRRFQDITEVWTAVTTARRPR